MTARMMSLTLAALVGFVGPGRANGDGTFPLRVNFQFNFRLRLEHQALPPSSVAPWYMWWPADANETLTQHDFQTSPYPTWSAPPQAAASPGPQHLQNNAPRQVQYQPNPYQANQPIPFQPVGYPRSQVPSYWYGR